MTNYYLSDSETASSSKTSTTDAQTLMEEILAEKKRKAQERQKATLEELKKAAQDAAKDAVEGDLIFTTKINTQSYTNITILPLEIQNSNKIREEAGPALPPTENGASEPADEPSIPLASKRNDRRASFVLRKGKQFVFYS